MGRERNRERERGRAHLSAQHEQKGEIHSSRIRAQSAAQLESLIHLSTSLVQDLESSVLPFQGLLQTKLLGCGASPCPEHSVIRLKAQEASPLLRGAALPPHTWHRSVLHSSPWQLHFPDEGRRRGESVSRCRGGSQGLHTASLCRIPALGTGQFPSR